MDRWIDYWSCTRMRRMSSSLSSLDQEHQNFLLRSRCSTAEIAYKNSCASDQECISCVCFTYFQESATSISVLRSLWQAHWLQKNLQNQDDVFSWLEDSILALEHGFTWLPWANGKSWLGSEPNHFESAKRTSFGVRIPEPRCLRCYCCLVIPSWHSPAATNSFLIVVLGFSRC